MKKLALLVSLVLLSHEAVACSCRPIDEARSLSDASVVFVGKPLKIEVVPELRPQKSAWRALRESLSPIFGEPPPLKAPEVRSKFLNSVRVTFEVVRYVKGTGPQQIPIMTGFGGGDCGTPVSLLVEYMIYAQQIDGALRTSDCFGSGESAKRRSIAMTCSK